MWTYFLLHGTTLMKESCNAELCWFQFHIYVQDYTITHNMKQWCRKLRKVGSPPKFIALKSGMKAMVNLDNDSSSWTVS